MAVTVRELLTDAQDRMQHQSVEERTAALESVAVFSHIARALDHLYTWRPAGQYRPEEQPAEVKVLIGATRAAATCWPHAHGQTADLVGAAADAVSTRSRQFNDRQRWALSIEFAETARRAVDSAREFAPYAKIPHLTAVRAAAVACERQAARVPDAVDATALDHLVPGTGQGHDLTAIIDAAAALHNAAVTRPRTRWRLGEVMITINAAQVATAHAAAYAARLPTEPGRHPWHRPSLTTPEAWGTARVLCRPFDDATKLRPPADSAIATAAARLGRTMIDQLGATPAAGQPAAGPLTGQQERISSLLTVTALLPEVASRLHTAVLAFARTRQLWAPERSLLAHEERNEIATTRTRIAVPDHKDLERLGNTLWVAHNLTAALTSDLAILTPARVPETTRNHTRRTAASGVLSPMAMAAHDAARHAHLIAPQEWAVPATARRQDRTVRR